MPTTLRQFLANKTTDQDVTVSVVFSVAGTDGELYVLETNPLDPTLPTGAALTYDRDGNPTTPTYDTGTASNIRPLPVILTKDGAELDWNAGNASAATQRVVIATDQPAIPTSDSKTIREFALNDNGSTNITTSAYVELIASTSADLTMLNVTDSGGRWYYIATGAASSEVDLCVIPPGGNEDIPVNIAAGTRISVKAIDGTASAGYLGINCYG